MNELEKKFFDVIKYPHLTSLATITNDKKPWVRYVLAVGSEDLTIRFSTCLHLRKVSQIKENPEVHLNCGCNLAELNPCLQIQGIASIDTS